MRLSNKQATLLVEILRATLSIANLPATYKTKTRQDLYDEIINQQSTELVDLGDNGTKQAPANSPEERDGS